MLSPLRNSGSLWCFLLCLWAALPAGAAFARETLSLDAYLSQVRARNEGLMSDRLAAEGAAGRSNEGDVLLSWSLFANGQYTSDRSPTLSAAFQGNETVRSAYSLGVTKLTSFGLQASLSYNVNYNNVLGVNPTLVPLPEFYDTGPVLELTLPLWKNAFGSETRANRDLLNAQALSQSLSNRFQAKVTLAEAESAYWTLSLSREAVKLQRENLERARELERWARRQVSRQLSDDADLVQASALVKVRELELQQALDDLRAASLSFNSLRGTPQVDVGAELEPVSDVVLGRLSVPERAETRDDVKAAEQASKAAVAAAEIGRQKTLPTLELFGNAALKGRDARLPDSLGESWTSNHPVYTAGVRLVTPLNFGLTSDVRSGYLKEQKAAELEFQRKRFEQDVAWRNLTLQFEEAKRRVELARQIEEIQKRKLQTEQDRHRRGRTTTFQVLSFEQDYTSAQLSRIRAQAGLLGIVAQMKTYGDSYEFTEVGN